jgi:hypothetical protein
MEVWLFRLLFGITMIYFWISLLMLLICNWIKIVYLFLLKGCFADMFVHLNRIALNC